MPSVLQKATHKYQEYGIRGVVGAGLRLIGKKIEQEDFRNIPRIERKREIVENYSDEPFYLNVGGGAFVRKDWRVLDFYSEWYDWPSELIDYDIDLEECTKWPIADESVDIIYSAHTLEHLTDEAVAHTLEECHRVLKPDGGIRINVPNIELAIDAYEAEDLEWFETGSGSGSMKAVQSPTGKVAEEDKPEFYLLSQFAAFLPREDFDKVDWNQVRQDYSQMEKKVFLNKYATRTQELMHKGGEEFAPGWHENWFDRSRLIGLLEEAGFRDVSRSHCGESRFSELRVPECDTNPKKSIFVEGLK